MQPVDEEGSVVVEIMEDPSGRSMKDEEDIIDLVTAYTEKAAKIEGVVVGRITGFHSGGDPLVDFTMNRTGSPLVARTTVGLAKCHIGRDAAVMFESGDFRKPIIIGLMHISKQDVETVEDDNTTVISSEKEILIRCGEASIHLKKDGKIIIKGKDILSRARRNHDIKGGMINLN